MKFMDNKQLKEYLFSLSRTSLKDFNAKIIAAKKPMIGVSIPDLKALAKSAAKENPQAFFSVLTDDTFEEIMLFGLAIGYADIDYGDKLCLIREYLAKADNWAHIDCALSAYKFIKKNKEAFLREIEGFLASQSCFAVRFGVVSLLDYYIDEEHLDYIFEVSDKLDCSEYYVSTAVAWLLATCLAKFADRTLAYLKRTETDDKTYNRTIRKAAESYRVDASVKELLKKTVRK